VPRQSATPCLNCVRANGIVAVVKVVSGQDHNLADAPELIPTRNSLLSRLKDWSDQESWEEFFNTYWRLLYGVAIKAGLTDQEAQEVVQETVITVARRIREFKYDPATCSFKTWLLNLTRWRIIDQLRKRRPEPAQPHAHSADATSRTPTIERIPDPGSVDLEAVWDAEWEQHLFQAAVARIKKRVSPEQYQMFDLAVTRKWPPARIARELGVSLGRVYLAKHRIAVLLRKEIKKLQKQAEQGRFSVPQPKAQKAC
jgi:RNA polymerase sigma factor (sigma-70 family)